MNKVTAVLAGLAFAWACPAVAASELLTNGDFETGTYAGWTTTVQARSSGNLFIDTPGTPTPMSGLTTAPNISGGNFYSVTDQGGQGAYALLQSFLVPIGTTDLALSFQMFANSYGGVSVNPAGLDYTASPNQHVRVDLLVAGASAFSTAAGDVVANFFIGADAGTNPNPYTNYMFDIFSFVTPGQTYQIRFSEVDNQLFLNQGVDNVSILATISGVPEPSTWAMMLIGFGAIGFAMRRQKRETTLQAA